MSPFSCEQRLLECEEALRATEQQFAAFREDVLRPLNEREHPGSVESLSWDELLGVAVRNLNQVLELDRDRSLLRDALTELMSAARAYLEPGGCLYGNPAMAQARAALDGLRPRLSVKERMENRTECR